MNEDLKKMDIALLRSHIRDIPTIYSSVKPTENAIKKSCERINHIEMQKAQAYYQSDILPEIQQFIQALNTYTETQDATTLRRTMIKIYQKIQEFNESLNYLIQKGLVRESSPVSISATVPAPPVEKEQPPKKKTVPKTVQKKQNKPQNLKEKYFDPLKFESPKTKKLFNKNISESEKAENLFNKNIEVILKITAEHPDTQELIFQYYLANKNEFHQKTIYKNLWDKFLQKDKEIAYHQKFRYTDWKPLFPYKEISEETLELSKNIFAISEGSNLPNDGLLLLLTQNTLQISFKTYGERSPKPLHSEFSGQEQPVITLSRKDFHGNDEFSCHYEDTFSFYHTFQQVHSETWDGQECLVNLKLELKLK